MYHVTRGYGLVKFIKHVVGMIFHRCHKYKVSHMCVLFDGMLANGIVRMIFHRYHKCKVSHMCVLFGGR